MRDDRTTLDGSRRLPRGRVHRPEREVMALVLAWSREEPARAGEVALVDGEQVLGRGGARDDDRVPRASFQQQRPGKATPARPSARA